GHKFKPRYFRVADTGTITRMERFKTAGGYRGEAQFADKKVHALEIHSPRYRWWPEPELVTYAVCGGQWFQGDTEASARRRPYWFWSWQNPSEKIRVVSPGVSLSKHPRPSQACGVFRARRNCSVQPNKPFAISAIPKGFTPHIYGEASKCSGPL